MDKNEEKEYLCKIGEKLRKYRVNKGLSQEDASALIGISQTQYSTIERGNAKASIITLSKILNAFTEISGDYLLSNDDCSQQECIDILKNVLKECPAEKIYVLKELLRFASIAVKS